MYHAQQTGMHLSQRYCNLVALVIYDSVLFAVAWSIPHGQEPTGIMWEKEERTTRIDCRAASAKISQMVGFRTLLFAASGEKKITSVV
jgi:hypothetical protein